MNSNDIDFDWHAPGVYLAVSPSGVVTDETISSTGYSARSELVRFSNRRWSELQARGWRIQKFVPAEAPAEPEPPRATGDKSYLAAENPEYYYPAAGDPPAPLGVKLQILTTGGVVTLSQWSDDTNFIAWAPLLKRNKAKEAQLTKPVDHMTAHARHASGLD